MRRGRPPDRPRIIPEFSQDCQLTVGIREPARAIVLAAETGRQRAAVSCPSGPGHRERTNGGAYSLVDTRRQLAEDTFATCDFLSWASLCRDGGVCQNCQRYPRCCDDGPKSHDVPSCVLLPSEAILYRPAPISNPPVYAPCSCQLAPLLASHETSALLYRGCLAGFL